MSIDIQNRDTDNRDEVIDELFREMYQFMVSFASVRLDPSLAEGVVQDTFLIATQKFDKMMKSGDVRGWLINVLKGEIKNKVRRQKTQEKHNAVLDDTESHIGANSVHTTASDETVLWEWEDACIQEVGKEAFELFKERFLYRIPIKDAAARHGLSESAYKNRTARTRKKLQKLLKNLV